MKPLTPADVLDVLAYEKTRETALARIIALKRPRRIPVGPELTFIFENRDTVWFQVQEMIRTERIVQDQAIQHELDVYNALLPDADGLSATLMIDIPERDRIRATLDRLIGIDEHVFLDVGERSVRARFDPKQFEQDRISAVQYVRFALGPELAARFRDPKIPVALRVEHPSYRHHTPIEGESRASLSADLDPGAARAV
jgi:Protein of unknown function (DUF3501)